MNTLPMKDQRTGIQSMLLIALLLGSGASYALEVDDMLVHADANSSAEHQGSTAYFLEKAADARRNAAEHRDLHARYTKRGATIVARHCKAIATRFDEIDVMRMSCDPPPSPVSHNFLDLLVDHFRWVQF